MFRSREPLSGASRAALSFLTVALIIFTIPSIFVLPAELVLFQPYSYKRALIDQRFYDRFPDILSRALIEAHALPSSPGLDQQALSYLSQDDYSRFFGMIFPRDWLQTQAETIIQNFWDFMNFKRGDLSLPLDLRLVKERLSGDQGAAISQQIVDKWPDCTADMLGRVVGLLLQGQLQGVPICRPPDMVRPAFENLVTSSLHTLAAGMPETFDLAGPLTGGQSGSSPLVPSFWTIYRVYTVLRWLFRFMPVFALAILVWMVLISWRSLPDLLLWSGQPLLTAGLVSLFLALISFLFLNPLAARLFSNSVSLLPGAFREPLANLLLEVANRSAAWSVLAAFSVVVVSLLLLVLSRVFEQQADDFSS